MPAKPGLERVLLLLSGEHPSLPYSETCAILESERIEHVVVSKHDQIFIIDMEQNGKKLLEERSAYVMEGGRFLFRAEPSLATLGEACRDYDWSFLGGRSFGAKANRVRNYWRNVDTQGVQEAIGYAITESTDSNVNLTKPDVWIRGITTDAGIFIYARDIETDRHAFTKRRPKSRPYFHPGVLEPKLSRAFVNMSGAKRGEFFVDPFCGTGGFLIEAAMMGMKACGMDLDPRMVKGAEKNLKHYNLESDLVHGDAKNLPMSSVDGMATNPPYGRGTTTMGINVREVLFGFLKGACDALRKDGRLCTAAPIELNPSQLARDAGLKVVEEHRMRVHKSLTRSIIVVKRD